MYLVLNVDTSYNLGGRKKYLKNRNCWILWNSTIHTSENKMTPTLPRKSQERRCCTVSSTMTYLTSPKMPTNGVFRGT